MKLSRISTGVLIASALGVCSVPRAANAGGPQIFDAGSPCTSINCEATSFTGSFSRNQAGQAEPFTLQVLTSATECIRLDIYAESQDVEMVLVSPSGRVWRNDDRSSNDTRPLIKAVADVTGWYTLQIYPFTGLGSGGFFGLTYGNYRNPTTNPNCSSPTPPLGSSNSQVIK